MRAMTRWVATVALLALGCSADGNGPAPRSPHGNVVVYPTGGTTLTGLATLDLVGDARRDLITIARGDGSVRVLPGDAAGAFGAALTFMAGDDPIRATIGDANGDGRDDIIVACFGLSNQLLVRLSTGSAFADPVAIPLSSPVGVALGDLDGDGKLDAVASNIEDGTVSLLHGNGDGSFGPPVHVPMGPEPVSLAVADFDRDGLTDIAVTSLGDHAVRVLLSPAFRSTVVR